MTAQALNRREPVSDGGGGDSEQLLYAIRLEGGELNKRELFEQLTTLFLDLREDGFWRPGETPGLRRESNGDNRWRPAYPESELSGSSIPDDPLAALFLLIATISQSLSQSGEETLLILREKSHIDPVFRDCYYSGYARQHFDEIRFSSRLSFFAQEAPHNLLFSELTRTEKSRVRLQESFIGSVVLNPTASGSIGRLLISPQHLLGGLGNYRASAACAIRLSEFKVTIQGNSFRVMAFPYRTQDGFMLRCVEVTLVNLIEYYSNDFSDYAMVLPSNIHAAEEEYLNERTLPAKGITYLTAAKLLSNFGFQARLHGVKHSFGERERFRRVFHHYLESGIPVAMNPADSDGETGHSLLCIGFASNRGEELTLPPAAYQFGDTSPGSDFARAASRYKSTRDGGGSEKLLGAWGASRKCNVFLSADLPWRYVVMDDNQLPYQIRDFDRLSIYKRMENSVMLVALHRGIMLDARDAEDVAVHLLCESRNGLFNWAREFLDRSSRGDGPNKDVNVMLRLFLASSRRYKKVRTQQFNDDGDYLRTEVIASAALPHFLWVAEVYLIEENEGNARAKIIPERAFAELVIDATHGKNRDIDGAIVLWNFPDRIAWRNPDRSSEVFDRYSEGGNAEFFAGYRGIRPFNENLCFMRYCEDASKWEDARDEWFFDCDV